MMTPRAALISNSMMPFIAWAAKDTSSDSVMAVALSLSRTTQLAPTRHWCGIQSSDNKSQLLGENSRCLKEPDTLSH